MAKKSSRRGGRGAADSASLARLFRPEDLSYPSPITPLQDLDSGGGFSLSEVEDRRTWFPGEYPTSWQPAKRLSGASARLNVGRATRGAFKSTTPLLTPVVRFREPDSVAVCVRRRRRREVLLALGRGGRRHRKPKRSTYSSISCRR